jgi:hypothetical protein
MNSLISLAISLRRKSKKLLYLPICQSVSSVGISCDCMSRSLLAYYFRYCEGSLFEISRLSLPEVKARLAISLISLVSIPPSCSKGLGNMWWCCIAWLTPVFLTDIPIPECQSSFRHNLHSAPHQYAQIRRKTYLAHSVFHLRSKQTHRQ